MMEYSPSKYFVELKPARASTSTGHRRALQFVIVTHRALSRALARGEGPELQAVAELYGVASHDYPRFLGVVHEAAPKLVHYEHPHELFKGLSRTLGEAGWEPVDCGCAGFENDGRLGWALPKAPSPLSLDVQRWLTI
jgi:hypothetical protein